MIPFYNAAPFVRHAVAKRLSEVAQSGMFGPGPMAEAFRQRLCEFYGTPYILLTASGTVGLQIAARAARFVSPIQQQQPMNVVVPAYGAVQTANAFAWLGANVYAVDVGDDGLMKPDLIPQFIDVVCFVDFNGLVDRRVIEAKFRAAARDDVNAVFIEDACAAFGHVSEGSFAGSFGDIGVLSFSGPKTITCGQGGALICAGQLHMNIAAGMLNHGLEGERCTGLGTQARMSDVQAAVGLAHLDLWPALDEAKEEAFDTLARELPLMHTDSGTPYHNILLLQDRDHWLQRLQEQDIDARRNYYALDAHAAYRLIAGVGRGARRLAEHALYLPFGPGLGGDACETIVRALAGAKPL